MAATQTIFGFILRMADGLEGGLRTLDFRLRTSDFGLEDELEDGLEDRLEDELEDGLERASLSQ